MPTEQAMSSFEANLDRAIRLQGSTLDAFIATARSEGWSQRRMAAELWERYGLVASTPKLRAMKSRG